MGVQELSDMELVEVEENWVEEIQNSAEEGDDGEVEDFGGYHMGRRFY